jgi:hypothetical protein
LGALSVPDGVRGTSTDGMFEGVRELPLRLCEMIVVFSPLPLLLWRPQNNEFCKMACKTLVLFGGENGDLGAVSIGWGTRIRT